MLLWRYETPTGECFPPAWMPITRDWHLEAVTLNVLVPCNQITEKILCEFREVQTALLLFEINMLFDFSGTLIFPDLKCSWHGFSRAKCSPDFAWATEVPVFASGPRIILSFQTGPIPQQSTFVYFTLHPSWPIFLPPPCEGVRNENAIGWCAPDSSLTMQCIQLLCHLEVVWEQSGSDINQMLPKLIMTIGFSL